MNIEVANFLSTHGDLKTDASFADITTIRIGGKIDYLVSPYDLERLKIILRYLKEKAIPYKIVGAGSNLICGDGIYAGCVIKLNHLDDYMIDNNILNVSAGAKVPALARVLALSGKSGFEFAGGIPGTIGGMLYMNAGAYLSCAGDIVKRVHVLKDDQDFWLSVDECEYAYRSSLFQKHPELLILGGEFRLKDGNRDEILALNADRLKRRMDTQPLDKPSAGSIFRNPKDRYAWQLIDSCDLRGYRLNGIMISQKHPNFIINAGGATANDFIAITDLIKDRIKDKYGIELYQEAEIFNC